MNHPAPRRLAIAAAMLAGALLFPRPAGAWQEGLVGQHTHANANQGGNTVSPSTVTASSGTFTNLSVTGILTTSASGISASTITAANLTGTTNVRAGAGVDVSTLTGQGLTTGGAVTAGAGVFNGTASVAGYLNVTGAATAGSAGAVGLNVTAPAGTDVVAAGIRTVNAPDPTLLFIASGSGSGLNPTAEEPGDFVIYLASGIAAAPNAAGLVIAYPGVNGAAMRLGGTNSSAIRFFPELHNSSASAVAAYSSNSTSFICYATTTITTVGGSVEACFHGGAYMTGGAGTIYATVLQDGVNAAGGGNGLWYGAFNAASVGFNLSGCHLFKTVAAGSHAYCLGLRVSANTGNLDTTTTPQFYVKEIR